MKTLAVVSLDALLLDIEPCTNQHGQLWPVDLVVATKTGYSTPSSGTFDMVQVEHVSHRAVLIVLVTWTIAGVPKGMYDL